MEQKQQLDSLMVQCPFLSVLTSHSSPALLAMLKEF